MNRIIITTLLLVSGYSEVSAQNLIQEILNYGITEQIPVSAEEYEIEAKMLRNDFGLKFSASAQHRFGEGFLEADLTENSGQTYYKAGISWDLLKSGWYQNKSEAEQLELRAELEFLTSEKEVKENAYFARYSLAAYLFDELLLSLYLSREEFLKTKRPLFTSLRKQGYFTNKELLDLEARRREVSVRKSGLIHSNEAFRSIFGEPLIISQVQDTEMPDVNITAILDDIENSTLLESAANSRKQLNKKSNFWVDEVSVKASLNYNHQVSFADSRRDFVSAGVSISIPLNRNQGLNKQKYLLADKQIEIEHNYEIANLKKELLMLYQEYAYKQKQLANSVSTINILKERLRVQNLQKMSVDSSLPVTDASLLQDDLISVNIEQLSLARQMMQLLVKMDALLPEGSITEYLNYQKDELFSMIEEVE